MIGAISQFLGKPVFSLGKGTTAAGFQDFLRKLRKRFSTSSRIVTGVLDNHKAHTSPLSKQLTQELNMELMFMPPYSPEFNCIEALWSVIKRDFKRRVLDLR